MQRFKQGRFQSGYPNQFLKKMNTSFRFMQKANALFILLLMFAASSCVKDTVKRSMVMYRPEYKTAAEVRANIVSQAPRPLENPGKLFYHNNYVYLNEPQKGVHVINISNPSAPVVESFIEIPGSIDIAVRHQTLYADLATDLVAIDISNPRSVKLTSVLPGLFPYRYDYLLRDSMIITNWVRLDTTVVDQEFYTWGLKVAEFQIFNNRADGGGAGSVNGTGGSMARFALAADRMYAASPSQLKIVNTSNPAKPTYVGSRELNAWDIETIFPFKNHLFMGASTGVHIYDISQKDAPVFKSKFEHARVCDPVVANDEFAYVTLRSGNRCAGFLNQLDILNISQVSSPVLLKSYPLSNPHGLGIDGNTLLICDDAAGLVAMDVSQPLSAKKLSTLGGFTAFDVIPLGGIAIVSAKDALILVDYSNPSAMRILSKIGFE